MNGRPHFLGADLASRALALSSPSPGDGRRLLSAALRITARRTLGRVAAKLCYDILVYQRVAIFTKKN